MQDEFEKGLFFSGWRIVDPSASHPHQALLALHTDGILRQQGAGTGEGDGNVRPGEGPSDDEDTLLAQQDGSFHLAQQHGGDDILQRSPAEVERRIAAEEDLSINGETCGSAAPAQNDDGGGADKMIDGIPLPLSAEGDGSTPVTAAPQIQPQERISMRMSHAIDEDEPCDAWHCLQ